MKRRNNFSRALQNSAGSQRPTRVQASSEATTLHLHPRQSDPARDLALALDLDRAGGPVALDPARIILVGSAPSADLRIGDPTVSARHARIGGDGRGMVVEDLGSTNGTYVDGVRVQRAWLAPGVRLGLGGFQATVVAQSAAPRPRLSNPPGMIGSSAVFQDMLARLRKFAGLAQAVLLRGETGTGKELAARALHAEGPRAGGPFVAVNCGAIPEGLFESELFGHVRGAFTGAARAHVGAFARAHRGTLFLDEIAELPLGLQAKLLRVLETRRVVPVGGEQEQAIDVRVVSATHQPMERLVAEGRFRSDLYHRLGVLAVDIPGLSDRPGDIPELVAHFAAELAAEFGRPVRVTEQGLRAAALRRFPGNIRELRNLLLRAAAVHDGPLGPHELFPAGPAAPAAVDALAVPRGTYAAMHRRMLELVVREAGSIRKAAAQLDVPRSTLCAWLKDEAA
ncbi:sigma 54-interacting transcriptional regulator [Nannocystis pusilla]|uniref:Sigma 54-interacting transcriptional regulator n=1 Tax=Nannocystis pusilla TaxID=889268 RepID=A0A9X3ELP5_9BACT|nr:sigma 54-interacting transcriptional regulator [Nannocystis pusilla]MCY1006080.1 sigma 54-interacting transcriptional regulator [Nannocystis pusilla]